MTMGIDIRFKFIEIDGKRVKLKLWDTAGQERLKSLTKSYFNGAHGIVMVYDVTDRDSFNAIRSWMSDIEQV